MARDFYYREQIVEIFGCDESFLDRLEEEDLVHSVPLAPSGERVFQADQVERIRIIYNMVKDLDVNLPGCGVILEMREQMIRMEQKFDLILAELLKHMRHDFPR